MTGETASEGSSFLTTEFIVLHSRIAAIENARSQRVNVYASVVALTGTGLAAWRDVHMATIEAWSIGLLTIGIAILRVDVSAAASVVLLYRRAGRIRCWHSDRDPALYRYLPWAPGDDTPPFRDAPGYSTYTPLEPLLVAINCTLGALGAGIAAQHAWNNVALSIVSGGMAVVILVSAQMLVVRRVTAQIVRVANHPYNVHFPYLSRIDQIDGEGHY